MTEPSAIPPELAGAVAEWAGLRADSARRERLAALLASFRGRVDRLYAVDVEAFEFDFLHPLA